VVRTIALAEAKLARKPRLVVASLDVAGSSGLDFLRTCAKDHPGVARFLMAAYGDIPELIRANAGDVVPSVLPKPVHVPRMVETLRQMLMDGERAGGDSTRSAPMPRGRPFEMKDATRVLRECVDDAIALPGVVVRQLPADLGDAHLELVVRSGEEFDRFHCSLPGRWGWPLKESHQRIGRGGRDHPVLHVVGELGRGQEVYARVIDGGDAGAEVHAYLALLPWRRRAKVTLVLGILGRRTGDDAPLSVRLPEARRILEVLHARAIAEVPAYYLPAPDAHGKDLVVRYVQEYDWVATPKYVGVDRRKRPTSLLNTHVGRGARKHIPREVAELSGGFVDRFPNYVVAYIAAYLVFALLDTGLTWWFVSNGTVGELNPILRPLIGSHPWSFVLVKNGISTVTIFLIARFHLFRAGTWLLPLNVALYALLDVYWFWLLVLRDA
jgi:hypothetical protein